jgi:hypothetical protein
LVLERREIEAMSQESDERRSEFRFPVAVPVEYFMPDDSGIFSYTLDLSRRGAFISSDDHPLGVGVRFRMHLNLPVDQETSRILRTEGTVVWNRGQPYRSKRNGMGVQLIEPVPERLLLNALAESAQNFIRETEAKKGLEERVEKLESELAKAKRLTTLTRCAEKIIFELSNPILTLSGRLELISMKMREHTKMLGKHGKADEGEFQRITEEFDTWGKEIDQILGDYKVISELARIVADDGETLERKLERYKG